MKNKYISLGLLLIVALSVVPEVSALPSYVTPLNTLYGVSSCGICHINPGGGGARNAYGTLFENQPNHFTEPGTTAALIAIGSPVPVLKTITVSPATANLIVGASQVFTASPKDQNGNAITATITWTSSNATVGTIDASGKFTASAAGTTTIKAASGTVNGTASVTVTASAPVPVLKTITVSPATANLIVGASQVFTASPKDQNGNAITATITWTSSNTTVGTIDANGKFKASGAGTTIITAANGSVSGTASVTVTAPAPKPAPGQKAKVIFTVKDNLTGKPIKNAVVTIDRVRKITNDKGIVIFKNVVFGDHPYTVNKKDYTNATGTLNVAGETTVNVKLDQINEEEDDNHIKDGKENKKNKED